LTNWQGKNGLNGATAQWLNGIKNKFIEFTFWPLRPCAITPKLAVYPLPAHSAVYQYSGIRGRFALYYE
jgi:hypothetical protein